MMTLLFGVTASSGVNWRPRNSVDPHHAEVVAAGEVLIEQRPAAFRGHRVGQEPPRAGPFVERDVVDDAHGGHAGKGAQAVHEVQMEPSPGRPVGEAFLFRRELEGVDVGGVVAGIDGPQPLEALHQQRGADEQHECERRLPDDEHIASEMAAAGAAAGPIAQTTEIGRRSVQRRYRAAGQCRDHHQPERGSQRGQVEPHEAESRDALGGGAQEERERHCAEDHGQPAGQQRDEKRLDHLQPDELRARRADRAAHGQTAAAPFGADQEQVRDVGARDEQHDRHRAEQHPQRCAGRRTDEAVEHRLHDRAVLLDDPRVVGRPAEARREFLRESRELGGELLARDPRLHARDHRGPELPGANLGRPDLSGHPEQRLFAWEAELRRHDADHLAHLAGDEVRLPDDRGIAAEPGAPEPVADDRDPIAVVRDRQPPELRPHAERGVDVVRRKRHRNPFDAILRTQRRGPRTEQEDAVEELRALLVMQVELLAEAETLGEVRPRRRAGQHDEAV